MTTVTPRTHRRRIRVAAVSAATALVALASPACAATTVINDPFTGTDGLITNEFAYYNPTWPTRVESPTWQVTAGSWFRSANTAYTGRIDTVAPNATSSNGTGSAVFRAISRATPSGSVRMSMRMRIAALGSTSATPATDWDGAHLLMRYQAENSFYSLSVDRRDGSAVIKKKCPGGTSNGGTYYQIGSSKRPGAVVGSWFTAAATVATQSNGSVRLQLIRNGATIIDATDAGVGCAAITTSGRVGLRLDNAETYVDDVVVTRS